MTETKFTPPLEAHWRFICDKNGEPVCEVEADYNDREGTRKRAAFIAKALNFYYAKKGEKE